jgi:hypothetical protein
MLLPLQDGGIIDIKEDKDYTSGCPTCDYGQVFTRFFDIDLTSIQIYIETTDSSRYPLSEGFMIRTLLNEVDAIKQMTEAQFADWLKQAFLKNSDRDQEDWLLYEVKNK